ncbi:MAG: hypothetical protein ACLRZH_01045 [Ruthenibacterium lactatiformans]
MSAKRIAVLVIVPIAVFAVSVGLFLLLAHPPGWRCRASFLHAGRGFRQAGAVQNRRKHPGDTV